MSATPSRLPELPDYGKGVYRRRIRTWARPGRVVGELQDDFHHFAVDLHHDGVELTALRGGGLRIPWESCAGSVPVLERLLGMPLPASTAEAAGFANPRRQCTHLFDLAALAAVRAGSGESGVRCYDVSIPDRVDGCTVAELARDGLPLLRWELDGETIGGTGPEAGWQLRDRGFAALAEGLGASHCEAALVLRRAVFISMGRRWDFEGMRHASVFGDVVGSACHTFSPEQIAGAHRVPGTCRDFGADTREIFVEGGFSEPFEAWLRADGA